MQTHVRVIYSEECGAPQSRRRMFVLAAARGELLPEFPDALVPTRKQLEHQQPTEVTPARCSGKHRSSHDSATVSPQASSGARALIWYAMAHCSALQ